MALPMELYTASTAPSQGCAGQASRGDARLLATRELFYALSHGAFCILLTDQAGQNDLLSKNGNLLWVSFFSIRRSVLMV